MSPKPEKISRSTPMKEIEKEEQKDSIEKWISMEKDRLRTQKLYQDQ